jgi:hypothetical protein
MNPQANRILNFVQGETVLLRIRAMSAGALIDMTGYVFTGQIRGNANALLGTFSFDTSTLATGYVTAIMDNISTAMIPAGEWVYDIFATAPDGTATVIAKGNVEVMARVTV